MGDEFFERAVERIASEKIDFAGKLKNRRIGSAHRPFLGSPPPVSSHRALIQFTKCAQAGSIV